MPTSTVTSSSTQTFRARPAHHDLLPGTRPTCPPVALGSAEMDASVRECLEYLVAGLKVARVALDTDPELAERELERCRVEVLELSEFAEHARRGGSMLAAVLREVQAHIVEVETTLAERFVTA